MLETHEEHASIVEEQHRSGRQRVLSAEGLSLAFGGNAVLRNLDIDLFSGDVVLLRGENGSGKTTLLNVLTGNLEPDSGVIHIFANGRPSRFSFPSPLRTRLNPMAGFSPNGIARKGVGRSWQDTRLFSTLTVSDNVKVASARRSGEDPFTPVFLRGPVLAEETARESEAAEVLSQFGLEAIANQSAMHLSLGDAKRTAIARSIQAGAKILFLDEPLSGLDGAAVQRTIEMLRRIVVQHGTTLVLIEHSFHIPRLLGLVTRVLTIRSGVLIEQNLEEVRSELKAAPHDGLAAWTDGLVSKGWSERLEMLSPEASLTTLTRPGAAEGRPALEITKLTVRRGLQQIIGPDASAATGNGVTLSLRRGEIAVLRAPNGWGKTSLAESIMGLLPYSSGEIVHCGEAVQGLPSWERARRGMAFLQAVQNVFVSLNPREMMTLLRRDGALDMTESLQTRPIEQLSGGERQRVALTACFGRPSTTVLILDEPFNMVDKTGVARLQEHIEERPGLAVLILVPGSTRIPQGVQ